MLTVYKPQFEELWFKQQMLADEETMSYNHAYGGTISFTRDKWDSWYGRWIEGPGNKNYYRYLKNDDGAFVGEMAYHYDDKSNAYMADVIIHARYRGQGFGGLALELLCSAAKENGIAALYDEIAIDNPAIGLFLKQGFTELYRTEEAVMLRKTLNDSSEESSDAE